MLTHEEGDLLFNGYDGANATFPASAMRRLVADYFAFARCSVGVLSLSTFGMTARFATNDTGNLVIRHDSVEWQQCLGAASTTSCFQYEVGGLRPKWRIGRKRYKPASDYEAIWNATAADLSFRGSFSPQRFWLPLLLSSLREPPRPPAVQQPDQ